MSVGRQLGQCGEAAVSVWGGSCVSVGRQLCQCGEAAAWCGEAAVSVWGGSCVSVGRQLATSCVSVQCG